MVFNELITLQEVLKKSFSSLDGLSPGDENVDYNLTEARTWIEYAVSSLDDAKNGIEGTIERLLRIDDTIEKKLKNAYHEPDYKTIFN